MTLIFCFAFVAGDADLPEAESLDIEEAAGSNMLAFAQLSDRITLSATKSRTVLAVKVTSILVVSPDSLAPAGGALSLIDFPVRPRPTSQP